MCVYFKKIYVKTSQWLLEVSWPHLLSPVLILKGVDEGAEKRGNLFFLFFLICVLSSYVFWLNLELLGDISYSDKCCYIQHGGACHFPLASCHRPV